MKEQLIKTIKHNDYDLTSACKIASDFINEVFNENPGIYSFTIGRTSIKIKKHTRSIK